MEHGDTLALRTHIRKLGPALLLITCQDMKTSTKSIRYWGTTLLDTDAQAVIDMLAIRWSIEVFFEDAKDLLGSDHYQLMTAEAVLRFWTLITCLACFLEEQRAAHAHLATWGDAPARSSKNINIISCPGSKPNSRLGLPHSRLAHNYPYPVVKVQR